MHTISTEFSMQTKKIVHIMIGNTKSTCFAATKKLLYSTKCTVFNNGVDLCTSFSVIALK